MGTLWRRSMKPIGTAILVVGLSAVGLLCAADVRAQDQTRTVKTESNGSKTKVTTKIDVKEGTDVKVIGCVERNPGGGYMLTNIDTGGLRYSLVTDDNLKTYLNHRVQVTGKAAD